ncbi:epithelial-stromal interaction protein 1 [Lates japonicus]|uniref:Epithelial-stromal interaction protein 1 n=1 Tax=Lates japonicus TaxID=270547 RepID=A0AAD3MN76_LATJO|nr:epithelial-stromal interaction protein 1 [Lates japonicus]
MDPYQSQRNHLNPRRNTHLRENTADMSENDQTADNNNPDRQAPDSGNLQATDRRPQYSGGYTVIPPNEARRNKMKTMAQKEEEEQRRWKETHRVTSVHENPERLGGTVTLAEARQKQFADLRCSKLQKKLKKEEMDRRRRQEEEAEQQKKRAEQREKAERLEERKRQEEQRRREQHRGDHLRVNESFLQSFERQAPGPLASSSATHTSSRSEAVERKQRSEREVQLEHKRVNSVFLDKLENRGSGSEKAEKREGVQEAECPCLASEDLRHQPPTTTGQQLSFDHLKPDPDQSCSGWTEEADSEPDYDWALMKLMNSFPECSKVFLEDILIQCNTDYEQACTLLKSVLS